MIKVKAKTKVESQTEDNKYQTSRLYRSETDKVIAGVCGGLGEFFNIDPTIIRIIFVVLTLLNGMGIVIYLVLWVLVPLKSQPSEVTEQSIKNNVDEMKNKASSFAHNLRGDIGKDNSRSGWAILIIVIGFVFLFKNFGLFDSVDFGKYWPAILIALGLIFLIKK